jgi:hypothetical protein
MTEDDRKKGLFERRRVPLEATVPVEQKGLQSSIGAGKQLGVRPRMNVRNSPLACLFGAILVFLAIFSFWHLRIFQAQGNGICDGYSGVLHISQGDVEGAAGTIFFLFVLNQLIYAEKHNLIPWVHLNNVSHYVYDPNVHGKGPSISFKMLHGVNASWTGFIDPISQQRVAFPGRPVPQQSPLTEREITVFGNGVWNSYFQLVSPFFPGADSSCDKLPLIRLTHAQIIPALHVNCPWSLRAWRYGGLPPSLQQDEISYDEWFAPMRKRGNDVVRKYVRFLPHMHKLSFQANPSVTCMALHIRHSDKANRRRKIPVKKFLPYAQAYVEERLKAYRGDNYFSVYLATDSHKVIHEIKTTWPSALIDRMRWQDQVVRSNDSTPVFTLSSHHVTNTQVLVDILAMSKCQFLLHGLSAVSEATHYLNIDLHRNKSVNLEIPRHATVDEFREMIREGTTPQSG